MENLELIKGAVAESVKPLADEVKGMKANVEGIDAGLKAVAEKVTKLEARPVEKAFNINVIPETYKGYKLSKQAQKMREVGCKDATHFDVFSNEEKTNEFSKWMIDFIKAKTRHDAESMASLKAFYQKASLAEGAVATGGYIVPDEYIWNMVQLARNASFALRECNVINQSTDQLYLPSEATLASVAWHAEQSAISAGEPTFGQVSLVPKRLDGRATASNELLADSAIDIVGILTEQFGYAIAQELDNQVLNGTGSPCSGILTANCGNSVVMATGSTNFSAITADQLSSMIYALESGYLQNAKFIINRIGLHYVRTLKDTTNNYIFANPAGQVAGSIWEYPYIMSEKITNTSGSATAMAVFGNLKKFYIGRRLGVSGIDVDPYGAFTTYETRFRIVTRWSMANGNPA